MSNKERRLSLVFAYSTVEKDRQQVRVESYTKSYGVDWDVYSIGGETLLMRYSPRL